MAKKKSSWWGGSGWGGGYGSSYDDDWFGRGHGQHVSTHNAGPRLGWDRGRSSYSSFFAPDLNKQKLIKDSFKHIQDIRDILDVPKYIKIKLHGDEHSFSDGKSVTISTKVFDDTTLDNNQKLDVFMGTGIHEFGHILHTDMQAASKVADAYGTPIKNDSFEFQICNMIEDERIESKITETYPGYDTFLGQTKYYYYNLLFEEYSGDDVTDVLTALMHIIRYPSKLDKKVTKRHKALFDKIRPILSSFGEDTSDAMKKAVEIWKLIIEYFKLPPPPEQDSGGEGDEEGEEEGNDEGEGSDSSSNSNSEGQSKSSSKPSENSKSIEGKKPKSGSDDESAGKPIDPKTEEQIRNAAEKLKKQIAKMVAASHNQISKEIRNNELLSKEFMDEFKEVDSHVYKNKADDNETQYQVDKDKIRNYISLLTNTFNKFFIEQEYALTGMRRGKLDTNKIAEAYQNVETVYKKNFKRTTPGLDICILIDESGSMYSTEIQQARRCAILLNEVCKKIPKCNLYIYGHTADTPKTYDTLINVYKDKWNSRPYALGNVDAHVNNDDSNAIKQVHKMVRQQTNAPLLMFVISDGAPHCERCSGSRTGAMEVKKVVNEIESKGDTIICQIAINSHVPSEDMFNHYVRMENMETFPYDLSKYIIHTLISKLKRIDV